MSSVESIMFQLTSGFVSETAIPTEYIKIPEINTAIVKYNWSIRASNIRGWTNLFRLINYSS
jgi:hypothetical protein